MQASASTDGLDPRRRDLSVEQPLFVGWDRETYRVIVETILRLPPAIQRFVLKRCTFVAVGRTAMGVALPGSLFSGRWLIVVADELPEDSAHSMIAHEIGHAVLGHGLPGRALPDDFEVQAARLAAEWGFKGIGADPDFFVGDGAIGV